MNVEDYKRLNDGMVIWIEARRRGGMVTKESSSDASISIEGRGSGVIMLWIERYQIAEMREAGYRKKRIRKINRGNRY